MKKGFSLPHKGSECFPSAAADIRESILTLRQGGVIAFPTDTVYGLGADYAFEPAVRRILHIKHRSSSMGLPLVLASLDQLNQVATNLSRSAWALIEEFWPGALTLIVPRSPSVSDLVTGGRDSVAIRISNHPIPTALARGLGRPVIATSANLSGEAPAISGEAVKQQIGDSVDGIIDHGLIVGGIASTIVDVSQTNPKLIRSGAISMSELTRVLDGDLEVTGQDIELR